MKQRIFIPKRITLIVTAILSIFTLVLSQVWSSFQDVVSSNQTLQKLEEVTNMPAVFLIILTIAVLGIFMYLWIDAGKETDVQRLEKKIDALIDAIKQERNERNKPTD